MKCFICDQETGSAPLHRYMSHILCSACWFERFPITATFERYNRGVFLSSDSLGKVARLKNADIGIITGMRKNGDHTLRWECLNMMYDKCGKVMNNIPFFDMDEVMEIK